MKRNLKLMRRKNADTTIESLKVDAVSREVESYPYG